MRLSMDALDYPIKDLPVVRDTRAFAATVLGRTSVPSGSPCGGRLLEPDTIGALDALSRAIRRQPRSAPSSTAGNPGAAALRGGQGDGLRPTARAWRGHGRPEQLL